ncbi:unnamed protein product [Cunninghamella blakesleeana]
MEETWDQYKIKPSNMSLYTEDATVTYVTSGAGAKSNTDIRRFYLNGHFSKKSLTLIETVQNRVIASDKLMEELEWTITFHSDECSWLLPNLEGYNLLNVTIKIPVVFSVSFENNLIKTIRVYWDQASVLKQLKVIGDRNKWPIIGVEQVNIFHTPGPITPTTSDKSQDEKAFSPGRIFTPDEPEYRPTKKYAHKPPRDIFNHQEPEAKPMVAYNPRIDPSFSLAHDDGSQNNNNNNNNVSPVVSNNAAPPKRDIFGSHEDDNVSNKLNDLSINKSTGTRSIFG